jgi:hypothetical protein
MCEEYRVLENMYVSGEGKIFFSNEEVVVEIRFSDLHRLLLLGKDAEE